MTTNPFAPHAHRYAPRLAALAAARGLAVTRPDGHEERIPVTATPVILSAERLAQRAQLAALLTAATVRATRAILRSPAHRHLLLDPLSPLERQLAVAAIPRDEPLANVRVDFFLGPGGDDDLHALEVNATIPAMQGYSDIAAQSFIDAAGEAAGLDEQTRRRLADANRPNTPALLEALRSGLRLHNPNAPRAPHIALLHRPHDAQLSELRYLRDRFEDAGCTAALATPADLTHHPAALRAHGQQVDLLYRHLFVRRLERPDLPHAERVRALLRGLPDPRVAVINPPASPVEVKTTFALLSQSLTDPDLQRLLDLPEAERDAVARAVPWTRSLRHGPSDHPDAGHVSDLIDLISEDPARWVIKRAWDYGGRAVFVGLNLGQPAFQERVQATFGADLTWPDLLRRAALDTTGGGFVVQEAIRATPQPHLLTGPLGDLLPLDLFVDFSAYASADLPDAPPWGGVCRGATSRVVNIVGGGGVLPLLTEDVAAALLAALTPPAAEPPTSLRSTAERRRSPP